VTNPKNEKLSDLGAREVFVFAPLVILAFWIGLYPKPFFQILEQPVQHIVAITRGPDYPLKGQPPVEAAVSPALQTSEGQPAK